MGSCGHLATPISTSDTVAYPGGSWRLFAEWSGLDEQAAMRTRAPNRSSVRRGPHAAAGARVIATGRARTGVYVGQARHSLLGVWWGGQGGVFCRLYVCVLHDVIQLCVCVRCLECVL